MTLVKKGGKVHIIVTNPEKRKRDREVTEEAKRRGQVRRKIELMHDTDKMLQEDLW